MFSLKTRFTFNAAIKDLKIIFVQFSAMKPQETFLNLCALPGLCTGCSTTFKTKREGKASLGKVQMKQKSHFYMSKAIFSLYKCFENGLGLKLP